jgi:hypothetical protein
MFTTHENKTQKYENYKWLILILRSTNVSDTIKTNTGLSDTHQT